MTGTLYGGLPWIICLKTSDWVELLPLLESQLMQFCHSLSFERKLYIPHGIQDTPYQQQSVWKTILGHIFPALKHSPVQDDTCHEFHGFSSDSPASHRIPSTPSSWLEELTTEKERNENLSTINIFWYGSLTITFSQQRIEWSRPGPMR